MRLLKDHKITFLRLLLISFFFDFYWFFSKIILIFPPKECLRNKLEVVWALTTFARPGSFDSFTKDFLAPSAWLQCLNQGRRSMIAKLRIQATYISDWLLLPRKQNKTRSLRKFHPSWTYIRMLNHWYSELPDITVSCSALNTNPFNSAVPNLKKF